MRDPTRVQNAMVHAHLAYIGSLTPLEALDLYGVWRLAARVYDLRQVGYNIITYWETNQTGKRYARYVLLESPTP